jgi:hypothetical protein
VYGLIFLSVVQQPTPFETGEEVIIRFIKVDDAEAVNFCVAGVFWDHYIHYVLPSWEEEAMREAVIE